MKRYIFCCFFPQTAVCSQPLDLWFFRDRIYIWVETVCYGLGTIVLLFYTVEKYLKSDRETVLARQKAEAEAAGVEWIPPEERLRLEEEESERLAEEARKAELKARCEKKGLDFETEEAKYQQKLAEKQAKKQKK